MTVAVVAGGDIRGDIRFAECHGLAMVSVTIMREAILMAFSASSVAGHFKVAVARGFDLVG